MVKQALYTQHLGDAFAAGADIAEGDWGDCEDEPPRAVVIAVRRGGHEILRHLVRPPAVALPGSHAVPQSTRAVLAIDASGDRWLVEYEHREPEYMQD